MVELLFGPPGTLPLKTTPLTIIFLLVATLISLDVCLKVWFPVRQMLLKISSVQLLSPVWLFATPWTTARQASLSITNSWSPLKPVHWVGDAIQPSHPLSSPSPPALNLSQHQGLFKWVSFLHQVSKRLKFQLQNRSFQWTPSTDLL